MKTIQEVLADESISTLEAEHHARDEEVGKLRGEMQLIHDKLEPKWEAQQRFLANQNPNLNQTFIPGVRIGK